MSKKLFSLFIFMAIISLIFLLNHSTYIYSSNNKEGTESKGDNKILIAHTEIFGKLERPKVLFDHEKHSVTFKREGCNTCHPVGEYEIHIFDHPFQLKTKEKISVMNSYHEKCIGCHQKRVDEKKKAGPLVCGDCHKKESKSLRISHPVVEFDFSYHAKHVENLKKKCELCHHIYDKSDKELVYEEGTEQSCYYCHDDHPFLSPLPQGERMKRGPFLSVETNVTGKKGLTIRKIAHSRCVNCHLAYDKRRLKAGPLVCSKCHTGKYKTIAELARVPRPDRDQPEKPLINIENARMKGVQFAHKFHEMNNKTCRVCHHETLNACKKCHGLTGSREGKWINTTGTFHDIFSESACAGCHKNKKSEKNCTGCHHHLLDVDLQSHGPKKEVCSICHSGKKDRAAAVIPLRLSELSKYKIPEKVKIKVLEREYEPSEFPHLKIISKMTEISNKSKMATYFHKNIKTICGGCHHQSREDAQAKKGKPPFCRNCHPVTFDKQNPNKPRLVAAYHRQCIRYHKTMNLDKPRKCKECHEEKAQRPKDILTRYDDGSSEVKTNVYP